jgi:hypothetical protein
MAVPLRTVSSVAAAIVFTGIAFAARPQPSPSNANAPDRANTVPPRKAAFNPVPIGLGIVVFSGTGIAVYSGTAAAVDAGDGLNISAGPAVGEGPQVGTGPQVGLGSQVGGTESDAGIR